MGTDCEIKLESGDLCGIPAIGRCTNTNCGRAFCLTHQGRNYKGFHEPFVDRCAPCVAKAEAEEQRRLQVYLAQVDEARKYFESGAARTALLTVGVPSVKIHQNRSEWKAGLFGRGGRDVYVTSVGRGWILGEFRWHYTDLDSYREADCLTALMDDNRFVRVIHLRGDYNAVERYASDYLMEDMRKVAQAVKRLTGESS